MLVVLSKPGPHTEGGAPVIFYQEDVKKVMVTSLLRSAYSADIIL